MLVVLGVWIGFVVGYEKLSVLFVGWSVFRSLGVRSFTQAGLIGK